MFYKLNSFSGRISASEAQATYHPEGYRSLKPLTSTQVPQTASVGNSESIFSQILKYQKVFQKGDAPIYLKGSKDQLIYRGAMVLSLVGLSFTFFTIGQMAMGKMKKKN